MMQTISVLKSRVAGFAVAAGMVFSSHSALAVAFTNQGYSLPYSGYSATLSDSALSLSNETAYIGEVDLSVKDTSTNITSVFPVYCVDIADILKNGGGGAYTAEAFAVGNIIDEGNGHTVSTPIQIEIAELLENTIAANAQDSAALQLAIWVLEYGNGVQLAAGSTGSDYFDVSSGKIVSANLVLTGLNTSNGGALEKLVQQDVNSVLNGSYQLNLGMSLTDYNGSASNSQTMVGLPTIVPHAKVPEPATVSLFGAGLAALAARRKRRR